MRYTVILVPDADGLISVSVPALPGCVSLGTTRDEAIAHIREAIGGWLASEADHGRQPPIESAATFTAGVDQALSILDDLRAAGDIPADSGYDLTLATVHVPPLVPA